MAAEADMTIVIRARDATKGVLKSIGTSITKLFLAPITLVGRALEGIYRRFFSLKNLLVGGGAIALLIRGVSGVSTGAAREFEPIFGPETQKNINRVQESLNRLFATLKGLFGRNIANASDDISGFFDSISDFLDRHADRISMFFKDAIDFFREAAKFIRAIVSGNVKLGDLMALGPAAFAKINAAGAPKYDPRLQPEHGDNLLALQAQGAVERYLALVKAITEGLARQGIADAVARLQETLSSQGVAGAFSRLGDTSPEEIIKWLGNITVAVQELNPELHMTALHAYMAAKGAKELAEKSGNEEGGAAAAIEAWANAMQKVVAKAPAVAQAVKNFVVQFTELANVLADNTTDGLFRIIEVTKSVAQAFKSMVSSILRDLGRLLVQRSLLNLFGNLLGLGGQGGAFAPFTGLFGQNSSGIGQRASGGPVRAGGTYVVGENGPELLQMGSQGGSIHAGAGGSYTIQHNYYGPTDPKEVERATERAFNRLMNKGRFRASVRSA